MTDLEPVYGETNIRKYADRNPLTAGLVRRFMQVSARHVATLAAEGASVLDVGVAEGTMTSFLADHLPARSIIASEFEPEGCIAFHATYPELPIVRASAYQMPFPDGSFDVVTAFEVLEHLEHPEKAIAELGRLARRAIVITVPYEPFFRIGNMARGKYLTRLGNTPGHVNHWRVATLRSMLGAVVPSLRVIRVFPWLLATASPSAPPRIER